MDLPITYYPYSKVQICMPLSGLVSQTDVMSDGQVIQANLLITVDIMIIIILL